MYDILATEVNTHLPNLAAAALPVQGHQGSCILWGKESYGMQKPMWLQQLRTSKLLTDELPWDSLTLQQKNRSWTCCHLLPTSLVMMMRLTMWWGLLCQQKKQIFHGQVIPICAGWFGDMCREFEDLIITNTQTFFLKRLLWEMMECGSLPWSTWTGKDGLFRSCTNNAASNWGCNCAWKCQKQTQVTALCSRNCGGGS